MFPFHQSLVDIPEIFHSVEFDGPFQKCQICTRELITDGQAYMIEKVFRGPETIIEIATCLPCAMQMQSEISKESALTIQKEFHEKVNMGERLEWLAPDLELDFFQDAGNSELELDATSAPTSGSGNADESARPDAERWLQSCILSGQPRDSMRNFQVVGMFMGNKMMLSVFPYLISSQAIEEIGEKLSSETRGYMQDFIDTQFGMPPEFCNPDSPLPLLL